jgi:anti-sigma factor RsiW
MTCPDELTLDLWLADALPADEAARIAAHVRTCAACAAAQQAARTLGAELGAALALDADELAFLTGIQLAAPWRAAPAPTTPSWGWIALAFVVGGYAAWSAAASLFGPSAVAVAQVGLGTLPLHLALDFLFGLGQALVDLARHPALGLSQPLLALFALALLAWPRQLISQRSTHA